MDLTLGEEPITTFRAALERVAAVAHAKLAPDLHGHLERAVALVKNRHVWLDEDGKHAQVLSSDGTTYYNVNGACTCMDAPRAPQGLCKHRLSVLLYRRASDLLATAQGTPAAPSAAPALPEAPASANARVLVGGHEVQVTLRDVDEERLLTRLAALLQRYPAAACGGAGGEAKTPAPAQTTATPTCPYHGGMRESSKVKGTFYCPSRMGDGTFCKEKFPKN